MSQKTEGKWLAFKIKAYINVEIIFVIIIIINDIFIVGNTSKSIVGKWVTFKIRVHMKAEIR